MPSAPTDVAWKAPREDAQTMIWPSPDRLLVQTQQNAVALSETQARVQGIGLPEVRRQMRQWIGHTENERPLIATGHQTELYHAGVWVKNVLINCAASALGGSAAHVAVDTDSPKHLRLKWPGGSEPLTDDPNEAAAEWSGLVSLPTPAHVQRIEREFATAAGRWPFQSLLPEFLGSIRKLLLTDVTISSAVANAMHALDWELGLRHHTLLGSTLWQSDAFALLIHHICARADGFAADYNASLADHRRQERITSATRPMPDLHVEADQIEVPFWLDDLSLGRRERAEVRRTQAGWQLDLPRGESFVFDPRAEGWPAAQKLARWLRQQSVRISPRALTLTLFLRLCLVDQFVHGIGGARYDQVTDRLIARHFKIEPPHFCVTTGTLYFPTAVGREPTCLPCLEMEGHQLKHRVLGREKTERIRQIARLPRRSIARYQAFAEMHKAIHAAARAHPSMVNWQHRMESAIQRSAEDEVMFDRELFYALQPRSRLSMMIAHYQRSFEPVQSAS